MKIVNFLFLEERRKTIATIIVAVVFLYFWMNGPLLQINKVFNIETIATKYSKPIMVGKDGVDKKKILTAYNTIKLNNKKEFGYGLITDKAKHNKYWGFVADEKHNPGLSKKLEAQILKHAIKFSAKGKKVKVHPSTKMYYATITDKSDKQPTIYLESTEIVKNIKGYSGEINVGIFIDKNGNIKNVEYITSRETQSYLSDIKNSGFYNQFKTIFIAKGNQQIDAVSGATLTSQAITKTVSELVKKGIPYPISNYSKTNEIDAFSLSAILNNFWIIHIIVIFLMFAYALQRWFKKTKRSIIILSVLSIIYIGFFLNSSFTYISFIHPFVGTSISSFLGLYSLLILIGAIWGKNTYCKYVCPFGNIQRLIIQINPLKTHKKFFISNKWIKRIRAAISIILLTGVLLGIRNWSNFELFPDLFGLSILSVWFVVSVITVLVTMVYPMIWCRLLCPTGSLLDGVSDLMKHKKKKRKKKKRKCHAT